MQHLPKPTYAPALMALGLMFTLWGAATSWMVSALGLAMVGAAAHRWIRDLRIGLRTRHSCRESVSLSRTARQPRLRRKHD